jgi:hypothetical protein
MATRRTENQLLRQCPYLERVDAFPKQLVERSREEHHPRPKPTFRAAEMFRSVAMSITEKNRSNFSGTGYLQIAQGAGRSLGVFPVFFVLGVNR